VLPILRVWLVISLRDFLNFQANNSVTPECATAGNFVLDTSLSPSFDIRSSHEDLAELQIVHSSVASASSSPEKAPILEIPNAVDPLSLPSTVSTLAQEEASTDDTSDEGVVDIVKGTNAIQEIESIKRRWFHESPNRSQVL